MLLTGELQSENFPYLRLHDKIYQAIQIMNDNQVTHLPVVEDEGDKYLGLISEDYLLEAEDDTQTLEAVQAFFGNYSVKDNEHFLKALQLAADNELSIVPVVHEDGKIAGAISYNDLLKHASEFMSLNDPGGLIVLDVETNQYSFNEISKIVETNDAQITQLNTSSDQDTGMMQVTIRVNKPEISDIIATFQRYEYNVRYYVGEELYVNELRTNYDNLMNYLKL
jgi:acetoin utilization protein AcuB